MFFFAFFFTKFTNSIDITLDEDSLYITDDESIDLATIGQYKESVTTVYISNIGKVYNSGDSWENIKTVVLQNVTVLISKDGSFEIERNGISATFPQNSRLRSGLLLPAHRLLLDGISRSSVNSVQKISGGILLNITLPDETHPISASFGKDGLPTVISGENFSYRVHFR